MLLLLLSSVLTLSNISMYERAEAASLPIAAAATTTPPRHVANVAPVSTTTIPLVPSYSQFLDISSPKWRKVGCGVTSLTMIIDYYSPGAVSVDSLLDQGIKAGAYDYDAGWIYAGLIGLSRRYGLDGTYHDLTGLDSKAALAKLKEYVKGGPAILSVHYQFDPASTIPHLVVIDGIKGDLVYYNDPASTRGEKIITVADFLKGWKKKVIVFWKT